MGEITDDIIEGRCCQLCGCYFKRKKMTKKRKIHAHGYPVVCKDCYDTLPDKDQPMYQKATADLL